MLLQQHIVHRGAVRAVEEHSDEHHAAHDVTG